MLELLAYFTYCSPTISPQLWSLWPQIVTALNDWAVDFFENVRLQTSLCIHCRNWTASSLDVHDLSIMWPSLIRKEPIRRLRQPARGRIPPSADRSAPPLQVLVVLDNYISRGTDVFLTCKQPDYLASVNQVHRFPLQVSRG